jgi:hypothetical protein
LGSANPNPSASPGEQNLYRGHPQVCLDFKTRRNRFSRGFWFDIALVMAKCCSSEAEIVGETRSASSRASLRMPGTNLKTDPCPLSSLPEPLRPTSKDAASQSQISKMFPSRALLARSVWKGKIKLILRHCNILILRRA